MKSTPFEQDRKQKYPLLIPPLDVYLEAKEIRQAAHEGYPLYKDYLFKPLHSGHLKELKRNSYLRGEAGHLGGYRYLKAYLRTEEPLNYSFFSNNPRFNQDWNGKTKFFTKVGRSESILRNAFSRKGLKVTPQYSCPEFLYVLDFAFINQARQLKINIEVDENYHFSPEYLIKDRFRNYFLSKRGWGVIRFTERQVMNRANDCVELVSRLIETGKVDSELWLAINRVEMQPTSTFSGSSMPQNSVQGLNALSLIRQWQSRITGAAI